MSVLSSLTSRNTIFRSAQILRFVAALTFTLDSARSESLTPPPSLPVTIQQIGGGSCSSWRLLDNDTVFLSGASGRAVHRISTNELIYGSLSNPVSLSLLDYSPSRNWALVVDNDTNIQVIDTTTNETVSSHSIDGENAGWLPKDSVGRFFNDGLRYALNKSQNHDSVIANSQTGKTELTLARSARTRLFYFSHDESRIFAIDGSEISYGSSGENYIIANSFKSYDLGSGELKLERSTRFFSGISLLETSHFIWTGEIGKIEVLDLDSDTALSIGIETNSPTNRTLSLSNDGKQIAILARIIPQSPFDPQSGDVSLQIINVSNGDLIANVGEQMTSLGQEVKDVIAIRRSQKNDTLYTFHRNGEIHEWSFAEGTYLGNPYSLEIDSYAIIELSPDENYAFSLANTKFTITDLQSMLPTSEEALVGPLRRSAFSGDSNAHYRIFQNGQWQAISVIDGSVIAKSQETIGNIQSAVLIDGNTKIAAILEDLTTRVLDTVDLSDERVIASTAISPIAGSSESRVIALQNGWQLLAYDTATGETLFSLEDRPFAFASQIELSANGKALASVSQDRTIAKVFRISDGTQLKEVTSQTGIAAALVSDNGNTLVIVTSVMTIDSSGGFTSRRTIPQIQIHDLTSNAEPISFTITDATLGLAHSNSPFKLSSDGAFLFHFSTNIFFSEVGSSPINYGLTAINLLTGEKAWTTTVSLSPIRRNGTLFMNLESDRLVVGNSGSGEHLSVDPASGEIIEDGFDFMPFDINPNGGTPPIHGTIQSIDRATYISLGQDGVLRKWRLLEGHPAALAVEKSQESFILKAESTSGFHYVPYASSNLIDYMPLSEPVTAVESITEFSIETPDNEATFLRVIEYPVDQ